MQTLSVDQLVGQILGHYRLEQFLGKGRLNAVYLAQHLTLQRTDALALYLIPDRFSREARELFLMRFRKEAAAITTLDHTHLLPVYEYGEYRGYPYLVTPYMTQGSLADILKREGRCEHTAVLPILEQLVAGISYAHDNGFIHGTLKPANVLLYTEDTMQVAGFGLMHMLQQRGIEPNAQPYAHLLSIADTFLAAPEYIAPEVVEGQAIDRRSDIYSLGCILYELLSGEAPFHGEKPLEVARQHVIQTIPALRTISPAVPAALSAVVHQALERDPAQRFQSVAELGEAFAQASRGATSYKVQGLGSTDEMRRVHARQDTPQGGYTSRNWQLQPPVATGRMSAIQVSSHDTPGQMPRISASTTDKWQLVPPIVTGRLPALKSGTKSAGLRGPSTQEKQGGMVPSAPPTLPPVSSQEPPTRLQAPVAKVVPPSRSTPAPANGGNSMPGVNADTSDLVKAYEWWSQSDQLPAAEVATARAQAEPVPSPHVEKRLPLTNEVDWSAEPLLPEAARRTRNQKGAPRKMQRRKVLAFIAGGGVIAAGTGLFLTLGHSVGTPAAQPGEQKKAMTENDHHMMNGNKPATQPQGGGQQANTQQAPAKNGQMTMQDAPAAKNPAAIGSSTQKVNSSEVFTNPADKKAALLIHMPDNSFTAYERACTHEGVNVNYDPATKMLVCPAHGAIFDPANKGSVVQGPAEQPLPVVRIKVNGDGSITAV